MKAKLKGNMNLDEIINVMSEDNEEAKEVVSEMMREPSLYRGVIICDRLGIRGDILRKLYHECCEGRKEMFSKVLQMFESGVYTEEEITRNLSLNASESFLDESIVNPCLPLYSADFNNTHPDWEEFAYLQRRNLNIKVKRKEALEKIPEWIIQGQAMMYPEKFAKWESVVIEHATGFSSGTMIRDALEIMTALEEGASISQAKQILDKQSHSGGTETITRNIILNFANRGPDFYVSTAPMPLTVEQQFDVTKIRKENKEYAEKNSMVGQNNIY
ncbi:MAG: hypothetical protein E7162_00400 [Firmicutes bacterium]|nr:hypothetical protein [Bacillota bacterium]